MKMRTVLDKMNFPIIALILIFSSFANAAVPVVTLQPVSQTVDNGGTATLTVAGDVVTSYAWYKRSNVDAMTTPVPASDIYQSAGATLTVASVDLAKEGAYYCVLTNGSGSTISNVVTVMTKRLVSRWELEDNSFTDSVSGFNGTSPGYPDYPQIFDGVTTGTYSAYFSGTTGDSIFVPFKRKLNLNSFTVCAWAKVTGGSGTYRAVLSTRRDNPSRGYYFYAQSTNTWSFWTGFGNQWNRAGAAPVTNGQWTFLVGTYDAQANLQNLYVNGTLSQSKDVSASPMILNDGNDFIIGSVTPATLPFIGNVDDVRYYSYPLTSIEIATMYADKLGIPIIISQPKSNITDIGSAAALKVSAAGSGTLHYAWKKSVDWSNSTIEDDVTIGTDSNTLTISNFQLANEGFYYCVITGTTSTATSNAVYALAKRVIANWDFENNLNDSSGSGLNLTRTIGGSSVYGTGKIGSKALQVSTIDDRVENASPLLYKLPSFSVSAWAKLTGGTYFRAVVSTRPDSGNSSGYFIAASDINKWTFWSGDNSSTWNNKATTDSNIVLNDWTYLVGTYDITTNQQKLYVNGVLKAQITPSTFYLDNSVKFLIGAGTNTTLNFVGLIDDVKYYDYVVSQTDIAQQYANINHQDVCPSFPQNDYNHDCIVDFKDFAVWAESWLQSNVVHPQ